MSEKRTSVLSTPRGEWNSRKNIHPPPLWFYTCYSHLALRRNFSAVFRLSLHPFILDKDIWLYAEFTGNIWLYFKWANQIPKLSEWYFIHTLAVDMLDIVSNCVRTCTCVINAWTSESLYCTPTWYLCKLLSCFVQTVWLCVLLGIVCSETSSVSMYDQYSFVMHSNSLFSVGVQVKKWAVWLPYSVSCHHGLKYSTPSWKTIR